MANQPPNRPAPTDKSARQRWSLKTRVCASGALLFHLLAIIIGPLTFASSTGPGQASPPIGATMNLMRPYVDAAFLNHGYFFFAPNPGASHIVRYEIERNGEPSLTQFMPDKQRHWPRLLYHRHFMLTESLNSYYTSPEPPPETRGDPEQLENWRRSRRTYEKLRESYTSHLRHRFQADRVEIVRVEHQPPSPFDVYQEGRGMRDPILYRDLPDAAEEFGAMNAVIRSTRHWLLEIGGSWDRFWFEPSAPQTLALIRILAGAMLFYTHLVWAMDLEAFLGAKSWVAADVARDLTSSPYTWSYLYYIESPWLLWSVHLISLVVFALLTVGLWTRVVSVLACVITIAYCHRLAGALYGLDQVNAMFAMYLMVGPCGAVFSIDRWRTLKRARRFGLTMPSVAPTVSANIAIRLIQCHMCVIYLFGGIGKMRGELWWDGSALWYAIFNYEYQSLDATWLAASPWLIALLTHVTVFWETFYCVLIWPRLTRPLMLAIAFCVHGGICLYLGMITFGLAMIIGNLAFISPEFVSGLIAKCSSRWRQGVGSAAGGDATAGTAEESAGQGRAGQGQRVPGRRTSAKHRSR